MIVKSEQPEVLTLTGPCGRAVSAVIIDVIDSAHPVWKIAARLDRLLAIGVRDFPFAGLSISAVGREEL